MLEAFERHLKTIDIGRKFENAKTNSDKLTVAKEFLEKNGYVVSKKEEPERTGFNPYTLQPPDDNPLRRSHDFEPGILFRETAQSPDRKVLSVSTSLDNEDLHRMRGRVDGHVTEKLFKELTYNIMKQGYVNMSSYKNVDYKSVTYNMKLGVFRP